MKMRLFSLVLLPFTLVSLVAHGAGKTESPKVDGAILRYYQKVAAPNPGTVVNFLQANAPLPLPGVHPHCGGSANKQTCIDNLCAKGAFSCQFQGDLQKVASLCHDVEGPCIDDLCSRGAFSCQFQSDLQKVAQLCQGVHGDCVKIACGTGALSCQFQSDLSKAVELCQDIRDGSCLDSMCKRGTFSCQFESDLKKAADLCRD